MRISAKAEYACVAVLELALRAGKPEPVRLADIAQPNGIPERFLVQILLQLKGAGFVNSTRGAAGGYRLATEPEKITVWDIIQTIDGPASSATTEQADNQAIGWQVLRHVWKDVSRKEQEHLSQANFGQLVDLARKQNASMYYI